MSDVIYYHCALCGKSKDVNYCNAAPESSVDYFGDVDSDDFLASGWIQSGGYCPSHDQDLDIFRNPDHSLDWRLGAARKYAKLLGLDRSLISWSQDSRGEFLTYGHFQNIGRYWRAIRQGLELIKAESESE